MKGKEAGSLAPHLSSKCCSLEKVGDEAGKRSRTVGKHQTAVEVSPGRHCDGSGWGGLEDFYRETLPQLEGRNVPGIL